MEELLKRIESAGIKRGSEYYLDYRDCKKLIKGEDYDDAIKFIVDYLNI